MRLPHMILVLVATVKASDAEAAAIDWAKEPWSLIVEISDVTIKVCFAAKRPATDGAGTSSRQW